MPRFAANLSMMFNEHEFLDRFAAAAAAGFEGVEFLFPYKEEPAAIRDALDAAGLHQALFNCPPGDWQAGERGLAALPGRQSDFRSAFEKAVSYAEVINPDRLHIMAGMAEGPEAEAAYLENLAWAAAQAPDRMLQIEPINNRDMPGFFLQTSDQAIDVLDKVGADNLGLQFDLYHCQIMEGDLTKRLERLLPRIFHMQIAGPPDRHEPDTGEVNFPHLFRRMDELGYQGWVGCEYRPAGRTEDGLGWFQPWRPSR